MKPDLEIAIIENTPETTELVVRFLEHGFKLKLFSNQREFLDAFLIRKKLAPHLILFEQAKTETHERRYQAPNRDRSMPKRISSACRVGSKFLRYPL